MASRWQRFTRAVGRIFRGGEQPTYQPPPRPPRPTPPTELPPLPPTPTPAPPPLLPVEPPYVPPPEQQTLWEPYYTPPEDVPLYGNIQSADQSITVYFDGIFIGTTDWTTWYNDSVHMSAEEFEDKYLVTQYSVLIYLSEAYGWTQEDWDDWRSEYLSTV